jgi:hypothetical protein
MRSSSESWSSSSSGSSHWNSGRLDFASAGLAAGLGCGHDKILESGGGG